MAINQIDLSPQKKNEKDNTPCCVVFRGPFKQGRQQKIHRI
jgi:hypothetical protein